MSDEPSGSQSAAASASPWSQQSPSPSVMSRARCGPQVSSPRRERARRGRISCHFTLWTLRVAVDVSSRLEVVTPFSTEHGIHRGGRLAWHPLGDGAVRIHHQAGRGVAQLVRDRGDARPPLAATSSRLPQIVEPDTRQPGLREECVVLRTKVRRIHRRSYGRREHKVAILPRGPRA